MASIKSYLIVIGLFTLTTGCTLKNTKIPSAGVALAEADYIILGEISATSCGSYILGINWETLFHQESTAVSSGGNILGALLGSGVSSPEASKALYEALDEIPEATHLLAPRVKTESNGFLMGPIPIFADRCATVNARGVRVVGPRARGVLRDDVHREVIFEAPRTIDTEDTEDTEERSPVKRNETDKTKALKKKKAEKRRNSVWDEE
jgi:hypothetical protein